MNFMEILAFRHACKIFDENKKISDENKKNILQAGRLSPSSFGMEPWKFLVIENQELKEKIKTFSWNQPQITTSSLLVVILAKIEDVKPQSGIPQKRFARRDLPQDKINAYVDLYAKHLEKTLSTDENIYAWTSKQCYLAASNMMSAAASLGIDSCPIEGFDKDKIDEILNLDVSKFQVALILPFGYRLNPQSTQLRLPYEEVVEVVK